MKNDKLTALQTFRLGLYFGLGYVTAQSLAYALSLTVMYLLARLAA